jgi:hypothetical protein
MNMKVTAVVQTEIDTNALADWLKRLLSGEPARASVAPPITFSFDIETYYDGLPVAKMTLPVEITVPEAAKANGHGMPAGYQPPALPTEQQAKVDAYALEEKLWLDLRRQCLDLGKSDADWESARKTYHTTALMAGALARLAAKAPPKTTTPSPMAFAQKLSTQQRSSIKYRAKASGVGLQELDDLIVSLDGDYAHILEEIDRRHQDRRKKLATTGRKGGK